MSHNQIIFGLVIVAIVSAFFAGYLIANAMNSRTRYKRTTNRNLVE